jgi:hypothetical protein
MNCEEHVPVNIAKLVEKPQWMLLESSPSLIRLERFDDFYCYRKEILGLVFEPIWWLRGEDGKGRGGPWLSHFVDSRELPRELVQPRAQTVAEVTGDQRNRNRNRFKLKPQVVPVVVDLVLASDGVRIGQELAHLPVEVIQVFLGPVNL